MHENEDIMIIKKNIEFNRGHNKQVKRAKTNNIEYSPDLHTYFLPDDYFRNCLKALDDVKIKDEVAEEEIDLFLKSRINFKKKHEPVPLQLQKILKNWEECQFRG